MEVRARETTPPGGADRAGHTEHADRATMLPRFWRRLVIWWLPAAAVVLLAAGAALLVYKRRPEHRAAMISEVVDRLMESDRDAAERAIRVALHYKPGDRELLSKRVTLLVMRGRFEEALAEFRPAAGRAEHAGDDHEELGAHVAWAQAEEAVGSWTPSRPPPAACRACDHQAEYAPGRNNPEEAKPERRVGGRVRPASSRRVRAACFPYLALQRTDGRHSPTAARTFRRSGNCRKPLLAIHANLKVPQQRPATALLKYVLDNWPNNPLVPREPFRARLRFRADIGKIFFAQKICARNIATLMPICWPHLAYCFS